MILFRKVDALDGIFHWVCKCLRMFTKLSGPFYSDEGDASFNSIVTVDETWACLIGITLTVMMMQKKKQCSAGAVSIGGIFL